MHTPPSHSSTGVQAFPSSQAFLLNVVMHQPPDCSNPWCKDFHLRSPPVNREDTHQPCKSHQACTHYHHRMVHHPLAGMDATLAGSQMSRVHGLGSSQSAEMSSVERSRFPQCRSLSYRRCRHHSPPASRNCIPRHRHIYSVYRAPRHHIPVECRGRDSATTNIIFRTGVVVAGTAFRSYRASLGGVTSF